MCFSSSLCTAPAGRKAGTPPSMPTTSRGLWHSKCPTGYFLEQIYRAEEPQEGKEGWGFEAHMWGGERLGQGEGLLDS